MHGDLYVLAVGVPLFPSRRFEVAPGKLVPELRDDLDDSWGSARNSEARSELLDMLAAHFRSNPTDRLLVVSGDVHYSSLYFIRLDDRVIGQEIVTSGIAHAVPGNRQWIITLNDATTDIGEFEVTPAGKIGQSASFAEVVVNASGHLDVPNLQVVFHTNGSATKPWELANTHLLKANDERSAEPLWYYPYRYDYKSATAHLDSIRQGVTHAGTIVPLPMRMPRLRTTFWSRLRFWGRPTIASATQAQSVFCTVRGTEYEKTRAKYWDLRELSDKCERQDDDGGRP